MADVFYASGGSNTSPYETWAKATTSFATALAAATNDGDRVIVQYDGIASGDAEQAGDTTYTIPAAISIITSTNSGTSTVTPTAMGAANWIGNSTTNVRTTLNASSNKPAYVYGLTIRNGGTGNDSIEILQAGNADNTHIELEDCYLWGNGSSSSTEGFRIGTGVTNSRNCYARLINPTFRFGHVNQQIFVQCRIDIIGGSISSSGSVPGTIFEQYTNDQSGAPITITGMDLSHAGSGNLVGNSAQPAFNFYFDRCKLGSSFVALETQTNQTNKSCNIVYISDCASGDTHSAFEYHDAFGSLTVDTGIYETGAALYDGTNAYSWKIVTSANCNTNYPFVTPWIDAYNADISTAITPYFEVLRDGSTTAYQDDEVWGEWIYKGTTGTTLATLVTDKVAVNGTPANQAASSLGAGDWTGEGGTNWFGKLAPASSFTPAEIGDISARVSVGEPSITVYVTPKINGLA